MLFFCIIILNGDQKNIDTYNYQSYRWVFRVTHLFDVLSVRWRDHLWGQTLRRVQAFGQLQIDQMKRQCKLLSSQFPNVSNVTKLPENTNRGRLHKSVMIYTSGNGYFWSSDWSSRSGVMETKIHYSENRAEANQPYEGKNPYVWYCPGRMCQPALQCILQQYHLGLRYYSLNDKQNVFWQLGFFKNVSTLYNKLCKVSYTLVCPRSTTATNDNFHYRLIHRLLSYIKKKYKNIW